MDWFNSLSTRELVVGAAAIGAAAFIFKDNIRAILSRLTKKSELVECLRDIAKAIREPPGE